MKITPKDYVDVQPELAKAGFKAISTLLDEGKEFEEVASVFGVDQRTVEVVKTTHAYDNYQEVLDLETEKEELQQKLAKKQEEQPKKEHPTWLLVVSTVIFIAIVVFIGWVIVKLVGGLF